LEHFQEYIPSRAKRTGYFALAGTLLFLFLFILKISSGVSYNNNWELIQDFFFTVLFKLIVASVQTETHVFITFRVPFEKGIWRRELILLSISSVTAVLTIYLLLKINLWWLTKFQHYAFTEEEQTKLISVNVGITFAMNIILHGLYELGILFKRWKNTLIQTEALKKENALSELESLKKQINPHFLFNSLNTLSSLMHNDLKLADKFIHNFSELYRYSLQTSNQSYVLLSDEIHFIQQFLFLQKARFGDCFNLRLIHEELKDQYYILPFCLYEVCENIFKHNAFSENQPIEISLEIKTNEIEIRNTYSPFQSSFSQKSGQLNILRRYELMQLPLPKFTIEGNCYIVVLPLLKLEE